MNSNQPPESNDLKSYPFNLDFILLNIVLQRNAFEEFDGMAENEEAKRVHLDATTPLTAPPNPNPHIISGEALLRAATLSALAMAHGVYRRQVLVSVYSLIEALTREFFYKLFLKHPSRMHDYIHPNNSTNIGCIKLSDLLSNTKQQLIDDLAKSASKRISDMPTAKIIKKMAEISRSSIKTELSTSVMELAELRNRIVHENYEAVLSKEQVISYFNTSETFAKCCGALLESSGVTVRWGINAPMNLSK